MIPSQGQVIEFYDKDNSNVESWTLRSVYWHGLTSWECSFPPGSLTSEVWSVMTHFCGHTRIVTRHLSPTSPWPIWEFPLVSELSNCAIFHWSVMSVWLGKCREHWSKILCTGKSLPKTYWEWKIGILVGKAGHTTNPWETALVSQFSLASISPRSCCCSPMSWYSVMPAYLYFCIWWGQWSNLQVHANVVKDY